MNDFKTIYLYPENISKIDISKIMDNFPFKNHYKSIKFVSNKDFFILKTGKNQQKQHYLKQKVFNQLNEDFTPEIYDINNTNNTNNNTNNTKYFLFKKRDLFKKIDFIPTIQYIPKDYDVIETEILQLKTQRNSNISLVIEISQDKLSKNKLSKNKLSEDKNQCKIVHFYIQVKRISDYGIQDIEDNQELRSFFNLLIFT